MSKFDAAERWLLQGISLQTKDEKEWLKAHPFTPGNDEEYRAAIRILSAAAKVDPYELERAVGFLNEDIYDAEPNSPTVLALLAALPSASEDGTPEKKGE